MNEPTLGQRIADAAAGCIIAEIDHGAGSPEALEVWAGLQTLCDRADAAERLARAADALEAAYRWHLSGIGGSADDHQAALGVFHESLAAWRRVVE